MNIARCFRFNILFWINLLVVHKRKTRRKNSISRLDDIWYKHILINEITVIKFNYD